NSVRFNSEESAQKRKPKWDQFVTLVTPYEDESETSRLVTISRQVLKLIAYVITFVAILSMSVVSTCLTLLMTSMVRKEPRDTIGGERGTSVNGSLSGRVANGRQQRIDWIWCLYLAIISPYVLVFLKSFWRCLVKKN